jgi:hypothetical protein
MRWSDGKFAAAFTVVALAILVAGCDRCGEWLRSEGGSAPLACKSDRPKPQ